MRLIDADWLVKVLDSRGYKIVSFYFGGVRKVFDTKEYIDKFPTIDPEDIRPKGKWEFGVKRGTSGYWCSNCESGFTGENAEWIAKEHNYCPKCGAKMEK